MDPLKKKGRYQRILEQLQDLLKATDNPVARMATIAAVLSHKLDYYFWCGFYFLKGEIMVVGPYQGPVACQILKGGGVCLESVKRNSTIIVPNVHEFAGHIACDSRSNSEIVVPVRNPDGSMFAVLDVDSTSYSAFDETDKEYLEKIAAMVVVPTEKNLP